MAAGTPPLPAENPHEEIQNDEYLEGTVAPNAFQVIGNLESELGSAITSMSNAGSEVSKLATSINKILESNDDQINRIVSKTEATLDSFQRSLTDVEDVLGNAEVRNNLKKTIAELPELLSDSRSAVTTIRTTVESVDRNLKNMEGFTGPLGERGPTIIANIDQGLSRLDGLLSEMSDFGRKLNSGEGSLGMLMRSPELYQHLNRAAHQHRTHDERAAADHLRCAGFCRQDCPPSRSARHSRRHPEEPRHKVAAAALNEGIFRYPPFHTPALSS